MNVEHKPLTAAKADEFISSTDNAQHEDLYQVRDKNDKKLDISDLFSHFTANIIKEDAPFVR